MNTSLTPQSSAPVAVLEPLAFPLSGSSLIEASAGTGKTFTIAMLYVRLVLGHRGQGSEARPLTPPEILVVTFTDAATKELRERIRARLIEAADYFHADPAEVEPRPTGEDLLYDLRDAYPEEQWAACARRLQLAAEWMDEAAVSTIHGWCNRMLSEHAFDSSKPTRASCARKSCAITGAPSSRHSMRHRRRKCGNGSAVRQHCRRSCAVYSAMPSCCRKRHRRSTRCRMHARSSANISTA
jgi:hypothetical protein